MEGPWIFRKFILLNFTSMEENNHITKVPDEIIRQKVMDKLRHDPGIDYLKIEAEVKNGVVTLKGKTDTEKEKQLSEKIARSVEGVINVENHLHIDVGIVHALSSLAAHIQGDIIKDDEKDDKKN
jgi:hypothetical protein